MTMSHLVGKLRATNDQEKLQRRKAILDLAGKIFLEEPYERITMAQIAKETGLAKGTLYLYFSSKEALVLALLEGEWVKWEEEALNLLPDHQDLPQVALAFADSLMNRRLFFRLAPLIQPVLEKNIDHQALVSYKTTVAQVIQATSQGLATVFPGKPWESYNNFLLKMYAHFLGLRQMEPATKEHRQVLLELGLDFLDVNFHQEFTTAIRLFLRTLQDTPDRESTEEN
jgi:AcrR family transcriptional regulator